MFPELTRDDVFTLETARLWLRWPRVADALAMQRLAAVKAIADMPANIHHTFPVGGAEEFVFETRKGNALGERLGLAVTLKGKPNALIGMIGAWANEEGATELGFWLVADHRGKGLATEAARAVIDGIFTLTSCGGIEAWPRVTNPASGRVLEKCGFSHAGAALRATPASGGALPCNRYALDRRTWEGLKVWGAFGLPISGLKQPAIFQREMEAAG